MSAEPINEHGELGNLTAFAAGYDPIRLAANNGVFRRAQEARQAAQAARRELMGGKASGGASGQRKGRAAPMPWQAPDGTTVDLEMVAEQARVRLAFADLFNQTGQVDPRDWVDDKLHIICPRVGYHFSDQGGGGGDGGTFARNGRPNSPGGVFCLHNGCQGTTRGQWLLACMEVGAFTWEDIQAAIHTLPPVAVDAAAEAEEEDSAAMAEADAQRAARQEAEDEAAEEQSDDIAAIGAIPGDIITRLRTYPIFDAIYDHIDASQRRPAPVIATGVTLTALSALTGRGWHVFNYGNPLRANILTLVVAKSGGGKNLTVDAVRDILTEVIAAAIQSQVPASAVAMLDAFNASGTGGAPTGQVALLLSEAATLLEAMTLAGDRAGHHRGIGAIIMELWSNAQRIVEQRAFAAALGNAKAKNRPPLVYPHLSGCFLTQPDGFQKAMGHAVRSMAGQGALNRFLTFLQPDNSDEPVRQDWLAPGRTPKGVIEWARAVRAVALIGARTAGEATAHNGIDLDQGIIADWMNTERIEREMRAVVKALPLDRQSMAAVLFQRATEQTQKVALLLCLARTDMHPVIAAGAEGKGDQQGVISEAALKRAKWVQPVVSVADYELAWALVKHCLLVGERMAHSTEEVATVENARGTTGAMAMAEAVLNRAWEGDERKRNTEERGWRTRRDIMRGLTGAKRKRFTNKEWAEALDSLMGQATVAKRTVKNRNGVEVMQLRLRRKR